MVLVVKDIIVIFIKDETISILISFKRYFSHPEKSILKSSLTLRRHCNSGPRAFAYYENDVHIVNISNGNSIYHVL